MRVEVEADKKADAEREKQQLMEEIDEELKERKQELDEGYQKLSGHKGSQVGILSFCSYPKSIRLMGHFNREQLSVILRHCWRIRVLKPPIVVPSADTSKVVFCRLVY